MISAIVPARVMTRSPLAECVARLVEVPFAAKEIIVVDNGSSPDAIDAARLTGVRLIRNTHLDAGCAGPRNAGAEIASGEILLFIDADVVVDLTAFERIVELFRGGDIHAAFGVETEDSGYANFSSQYRNLWVRFTLTRLPRDAGLLHSSCVAIRADLFHHLGGFDERFRECSVEDVDLGRRIVAAGGTIVRDEGLSFQHRRPFGLGGLLAAERSRAAALAALQLRALRDGVPGVGRSYTVPIAHRYALAVFGASVFAFAFAALRWDLTLALAALAGAVLSVVLRSDFLVYLSRRRGVGFGLAAAAFLPLDHAWVLLGVLEGIRDDLLGRR